MFVEVWESLQLKQDLLKIEEPTEAVKHVENFLKDYVAKASAEGVVFGMSGGLDSSVVAAICSRAFKDRNKVLGLCMPEEETHNPRNIKDAEHIAEIFNIKFEIIDITPITKTFFKEINIFKPEKQIANGNVKARVRAVVLFYYSNMFNRLVVGTTDKSEMMLG